MAEIEEIVKKLQGGIEINTFSGNPDEDIMEQLNYVSKVAAINGKCMLMENEPKKDIKTMIRSIQRAWNTCPNPYLDGKSPFYIMFGQEDTALEEKFDIPTTPEDRDKEIEVKKFRKKIPEILNKNYENYRKYYNEKRKDLMLKKGDMVLVKNPFPLKMDPIYEGPYEVVKIVGQSTIEMIDKMGKRQKIHISRVKKYF